MKGPSIPSTDSVLSSLTLQHELCVCVFSLAPCLIQPCQPPLLGGSSTQRILADPGRGGRKRATTDAQKRRRPTPARSSRQHPVAQLPGSKADGVRKDAKWGGLPALRRRLLVNCDGSKDDTSFRSLITLLQVRHEANKSLSRINTSGASRITRYPRGSGSSKPSTIQRRLSHSAMATTNSTSERRMSTHLALSRRSCMV